MEDAHELDVREFADADALVAAAAAASLTRDGAVTLTNLRVTHRKRRGQRQFWVTAAPPAGGLEVHMSFRRADLDDGRRDVTMLWETDAHAAAFEAATPGAIIARASGTLEAPRRQMEDGHVAGTRRCMWCGAASCAGSSPGRRCPAAAPVLRCGRIEWSRTSPNDDDDDDDDDTAGDDTAGDAWLVFDMAFDRDMNAAEHGALSRQMSMCVAANRRARRPFRIAAISPNEADDDPSNAAAPSSSSSGQCITSEHRSDAEYSFVVSRDDTADPAMGRNAWRRLPWARWGATCGGPRTWRRFDPNRVIYLSADAAETLDEIADGDVLVIGGLVDHREKPGMALDRALDDVNAPIRWRTARLPLGGHVRLLKNAHLPCLAVCQLLLLARDLAGDALALDDGLAAQLAAAAAERGGGGREGRDGRRKMKSGGDERDVKDEKDGGSMEGGSMRGAWNLAISSCPAFRCAPLHKYVVWLPPHDALNGERRGGARNRPSGVTDVRALVAPS